MNQSHKKSIWDKKFVGFNISSRLSDEGINDLAHMGVTCVRVGAVGLGDEIEFDLKELRTNTHKCIKELETLICKLESKSISIVFTLDKRLANVENWTNLVHMTNKHSNVIGYDLINEPSTDGYLPEMSEQIRLSDTNKILDVYNEIIAAIRAIDTFTPIILESLYWAHIDMLKYLVDCLHERVDSNLYENIILSYHFYEPKILTTHVFNKERYTFPGNVPIHKYNHSEQLYWDEMKIRDTFKCALEYALSKGFRVFVGEIGISRNVKGAEKYLKCCVEACVKMETPCCLFR